jgi:hypothetical protein
MNNTVDLYDVLVEAKTAARHAASKFFAEKMNNVDGGSCGFAWVSLYKFNGKKLDGRSKVAKELKRIGVGQNWNRTFEIWNPSNFPCQNIDTLEVGARAAAEVFQKYGFEAYAGSRLD